MGLMLRYNLFYTPAAGPVCSAFKEFYSKRGRLLQGVGEEDESISIHESNNAWVVAGLGRGWEWKERREAQLFVSRRLWCPGFLVFVYDGDYWGYEFFDHGEVFDHFVQQGDEDEITIGFPGEDCSGNAEVLVEHLPLLKRSDVQPYLVRIYGWRVPEELAGKVRPGDEFDRSDECDVLDFLRVLGVRVGLRDNYVTPEAPIYCKLYKRTT